MNTDINGRPKTLSEAKAWMHQRLASRTHPMNALPLQDGPAWIDGVPGLDGAAWGRYWGELGDDVAARAAAAERAGDDAHAAELFQKASGLYFLGRFPCPNHPAKQRCAEAERQAYLSAARHWPQPVQRRVVPFAGREGEGAQVVLLVRRPSNITRPPVVLTWGGVDACMDQMTAASGALLALGVATVAMDNAGTGESPVRGVPDAERVFITAMDWIAAQADLDGARLGLLGRSFGGYWATKLAHLLPERIAGAVNWGGGAHPMFQPQWIDASRHPDSYLMDLVETRCRMLGARDDVDVALVQLPGQVAADRPQLETDAGCLGFGALEQRIEQHGLHLVRCDDDDVAFDVGRIRFRPAPAAHRRSTRAAAPARR